MVGKNDLIDQDMICFCFLLAEMARLLQVVQIQVFTPKVDIVTVALLFQGMVTVVQSMPLMKKIISKNCHINTI